MVPADRKCRFCGAPVTPGAGKPTCSKCRNAQQRVAWARDWQSYLSGRIRIAKHRAKKKKLPFTIDLAYCMQLLVEQDHRCAITGLPFTRSATGDDMDITLDRIDSDQGYEPGNVSLIGYRVNQMKSDLTLQKFLWWCKAISNHDQDRTSR